MMFGGFKTGGTFPNQQTMEHFQGEIKTCSQQSVYSVQSTVNTIYYFQYTVNQHFKAPLQCTVELFNLDPVGWTSSGQLGMVKISDSGGTGMTATPPPPPSPPAPPPPLAPPSPPAPASPPTPQLLFLHLLLLVLFTLVLHLMFSIIFITKNKTLIYTILLLTPQLGTVPQKGLILHLNSTRQSWGCSTNTSVTD